MLQICDKEKRGKINDDRGCGLKASKQASFKR